MANLEFYVGYAPDLADARNTQPSFNIYAEDLGLCTICTDKTGSCFACLQITQQVFTDDTLTTIVADGYYNLFYTEGNAATWHIVGGYPQSGGFYN